MSHTWASQETRALEDIRERSPFILIGTIERLSRDNGQDYAQWVAYVRIEMRVMCVDSGHKFARIAACFTVSHTCSPPSLRLPSAYATSQKGHPVHLPCQLCARDIGAHLPRGYVASFLAVEIKNKNAIGYLNVSEKSNLV